MKREAKKIKPEMKKRIDEFCEKCGKNRQFIHKANGEIVCLVCLNHRK